MSRYSYKDVERIINKWNSNHPEVQLSFSVFNGYYHIGYAGPHGSVKYNFIVQPGPGATLEAFEVWRDGYFKGKEMAKQ